MSDMRRTWLVQRLNPPRSPGLFGTDNPFAFGGGLRNGGLSETAMDLLRGIFTFDYMGAAEFEFGAVPEALQGLAADQKRLTADTLTIALKDVARHWTDKSTTVLGWLELNNGYAFFTDRQMWEATCELFGVKVPEVAAS